MSIRLLRAPARRVHATLLLLLFSLFWTYTARAQDDEHLSFVRDAETEQLIRSYAVPIFKAAGLDADAVHVYLVNSDEINAFVAGGQNLFLFTGLILETDTPNQLTGVIAHETGHIAGGHLARSDQEMGHMTVPMIVSLLLGAAAMAAGSPDAGMAVLAGSSQLGERTMIQFTRTQEASADQAGAGFLERAHESGRGMLEMFQKLSGRELVATHNIDPFLLDHPLSTERISSLEDRVDASPYKDVKDPPALLERHALMKAKLYGFIKDSMVTLRKYPLSDRSMPARYARAIAYHRAAEDDFAMREMDSLLAERPNNPFFWELKGQILFEGGHVREAIAPFQKALDLAPNLALLRINVAQAMIATEDPGLTKPAIGLLDAALQTEREYPFAWQQLAMAYGQEGNEGMASLATAESQLLTGHLSEAKFHARRATRLIPKNSPDALRAADLLDEVNRQAKQQRRFGS